MNLKERTYLGYIAILRIYVGYYFLWQGYRKYERGVFRLHRHGEAKVALGVLVAAIDFCVIRECHEFFERIVHLFVGAFEQTAASRGEQRVTAEQVVLEKVSDVKSSKKGKSVERSGNDRAESNRRRYGRDQDGLLVRRNLSSSAQRQRPTPDRGARGGRGL